MRILRRMGNFFLNIFGFRKNNNYVKKYLNEANVRSSIYMGFIVVILEITMILRALYHKNVADLMSWGHPIRSINILFQNTSQYWLFMFVGAALTIFAIDYISDKNNYSKFSKIAPFISSGVLIISSLFIFKEITYFKKWNLRYYRVSNLGVIFLYVFTLIMGLSLLSHALYKFKNKKNNRILSDCVIVSFALICLTFGVKVGYTDFFSGFYLGTGLPKGVEIKSIICFLTMVIYVACLLIWKPYISIVMMTSIFVGFFHLLNGDPSNRIFAEGEQVNYWTFLISLTMISISIYQQRLSEVKKDINLENIAKYDELTEINNFQHFGNTIITLQNSDPNSIRNNMYLFFNIENFKVYNDQRTFEKGNELLYKFGHLLEDEFPGDIVARQGDDHFVVFTGAKNVMDKLKSISLELIDYDKDIKLELKVGGYIPELFEKPIRAVDKARYACGTIKNKYNMLYREYDAKMDDGFHKKQYIINNIDKAIESGWIVPYYQPVVWSESKELCGCEALARWLDPVYGFLSPGDFIPILEECRQIHKLDICIWESVCKNMRDAIDRGREVVPVSLNFSRLDFELMDAVTIIENLVNKYNIDKNYIHIEITESALADDLGILAKSIKKLHDDGYAIWLDDFGSGYSSLNVLKDYEFDVLKIDMKFLTNFSQNPKTKEILDCIIQLAQRLNMKTLTEGVETDEEAQYLKSIGCDRLQGYLFGKPINMKDLELSIDNGKYKESKTIL